MNSYQNALALMGYPSITSQYAQGIQALLAANSNPYGYGSSNLQAAMPGSMQLPSSLQREFSLGDDPNTRAETMSPLEGILELLKGQQQANQFPVDRSNYAVSGNLADQIRTMSGGLYAGFMNELPEGQARTFEQPGRPESDFKAKKFKGLDDGKFGKKDMRKAIKQGANDYDIRDLFKQAKGMEGVKIGKGAKSAMKDVFRPAIRSDIKNRKNAQRTFNRDERTRLNAMNYQAGMYDVLRGLSGSMLGGNMSSGTGFQQNQGNFSVDPMQGGAYANPQAGPTQMTFPGLTGSNYSGNFSYALPDSLRGGGLG